ncbi:ABC transporter permease [Allorhizocola rhizosphaerae]|uniref:ABC transporter permease n=1 Tax=Allorhizocola rhizosphaerae TaxID=1872709 RepID=UPI0013C327CB|nr:ABC transporter permease subunit [Allorhizocola rhizosphaerae]
MSRALLGATGLLGLIAIGEAVPRLGLVPIQYAPPPSRIAAALASEAQQPRFWTAVGDTLRTWAEGLAIALVAGVVLGVVIGSVPLLRAATASTIEFLRPIPSVALIPLAALLYGATITSTRVLVVYAAFWQVLVQVLHGVADVDPVAHETARVYRLGRWARVRYLIWPTALPYALTGLRLAASVALILAITGELVIGSPGLGREIAVAQGSGVSAVPTMYAYVVVTGLIGLCANAFARMGERRILAWHPAIRREVAAA